MIDLNYIASYVVSSGDGDRCGLSELLAAMQTRQSDASSEEIFEACVAACLPLVKKQHVRLEMTPAHADRPGRGGYTQISQEKAPEVLCDPASWQSPRESQPHYWLVATEAGKAAYISEDIISL
ncbi:MAG: hypothetical protein IH973_05845 [Myxococcales bacterium]|nr:hypothetical protein [Myxococcales bacterium]